MLQEEGGNARVFTKPSRVGAVNLQPSDFTEAQHIATPSCDMLGSKFDKTDDMHESLCNILTLRCRECGFQHFQNLLCILDINSRSCSPPAYFLESLKPFCNIRSSNVAISNRETGIGAGPQSSSTAQRLEFLGKNPILLKSFGDDLLPLLLQVYNSTASPQVWICRRSAEKQCEISLPYVVKHFDSSSFM